MKKGCFLIVISLVTIIVMAGIYIYKTNKDFFQNFGKDKLITLATNEIDESIKKLKNTPYKDSLIFALRKEVKQISSEDFEKAMNKFGLVAEKIKLVINDGVLDSTEFAEVKAMVKSHDRSEKNRN